MATITYNKGAIDNVFEDDETYNPIINMLGLWISSVQVFHENDFVDRKYQYQFKQEVDGQTVTRTSDPIGWVLQYNLVTLPPVDEDLLDFSFGSEELAAIYNDLTIDFVDFSLSSDNIPEAADYFPSEGTVFPTFSAYEQALADAQNSFTDAVRAYAEQVTLSVDSVVLKSPTHSIQLDDLGLTFSVDMDTFFRVTDLFAPTVGAYHNMQLTLGPAFDQSVFDDAFTSLVSSADEDDALTVVLGSRPNLSSIDYEFDEFSFGAGMDILVAFVGGRDLAADMGADTDVVVLDVADQSDFTASLVNTEIVVIADIINTSRIKLNNTVAGFTPVYDIADNTIGSGENVEFYVQGAGARVFGSGAKEQIFGSDQNDALFGDGHPFGLFVSEKAIRDQVATLEGRPNFDPSNKADIDFLIGLIDGSVKSVPLNQVQQDKDILRGMDGNDLLVASPARAAEIYGGIGNDISIGGNGDDTIRGEDGNDEIFGAAGTNTYFGGSDSDIFNILRADGKAQVNKIYGGASENDSSDFLNGNVRDVVDYGDTIALQYRFRPDPFLTTSGFGIKLTYVPTGETDVLYYIDEVRFADKTITQDQIAACGALAFFIFSFEEASSYLDKFCDPPPGTPDYVEKLLKYVCAITDAAELSADLATATGAETWKKIIRFGFENTVFASIDTVKEKAEAFANTLLFGETRASALSKIAAMSDQWKRELIEIADDLGDSIYDAILKGEEILFPGELKEKFDGFIGKLKEEFGLDYPGTSAEDAASDFNIELQDLEPEPNDTKGPTLPEIDSPNEVKPKDDPDTIILPKLAINLEGMLENFNGDSVFFFDGDDKITFLDTNFGQDSLTVTFGSAILDIDADLDGTVDATITLEGNFEGAEFEVRNVGENTEITLAGNPTNDAPIAANDTAETDEDNSVTFNILDNDSDPDGDPILLNQVFDTDGALIPFDVETALVGGGTITISQDGTTVFDPAGDFEALGFNLQPEPPAATFDLVYNVVESTDEGLVSDNATVTIDVRGLNDAPVADDFDAETTEDVSVILPVLDMVSDVDGDDLELVFEIDPAIGEITFDGEDYRFTPAPDVNGDFDIQYIVTDENDSSTTGTLSLTVEPVNDDPVAVDDDVTTDQNTFVAIDFLANDSDPDGDGLTVTSVGPASNGLSSLAGYTPDPGFFGTDSFTYTISDGNGGTATATAMVTVNQTVFPNQDPVAVDDDATTDQNTFVAIDFLANDSDPDGDGLTVTSVGPASNGLSSLAGYEPDPGFFGTDSFTYTISDGNGGTATATAMVTVNQTVFPNQDPVAVDDDATTDQNTFVAIDFLANDSDPDGDGLTVTSVGPASNGLSSLDGYTPDPGFLGTDSFTYTISDGNGGFDTATATVTVTDTTEVADYSQSSGSTYTRLDRGWSTALENKALGWIPLTQGIAADTVPHDDLVNIKDIIGSDFTDLIVGNKGSNIIRAGGGNDFFSGFGGDDTLFGEEGNDRVFGHLGNDTLDGGEGNDQLTGGEGLDIFIFNGGHDEILDFDPHLGDDNTGSDGDLVSISIAGIADFDDLVATASQDGADTVFTISDDDRLTLQNTLLITLEVDDFKFV